MKLGVLASVVTTALSAEVVLGVEVGGANGVATIGAE